MTQPRFSPIRRRVQVDQPPVGTDWQRANDSAGLWLIRSLVARLVTSAAVATRLAQLRASQGTEVYFRTVAGATQAAGLTRDYVAYNGSTPATDGVATVQLGWPHDGLWLPPGAVLAVTTALIDVADQWSTIVLDLIEYPEEAAPWLYPSPGDAVYTLPAGG